MRKYLVLLFIAGIVLASVAIAGASMDTVSSSKVHTNLIFKAPNYARGRDGHIPVHGLLLTDDSVGIANAKVHFQSLEGGDVWTTYFNAATDETGYFSFAVKPKSAPPGTNYAVVNFFRMTYDGDSQYAPCVSNEVEMDVSW